MTPPYHQYIRKAVVALALVALAAWLLPSFVGAERYRRRLEAGLERALKRPVTFGAVAFHLLPRPGFSIADALVREDPAFGSEPFARVERIDCELRWRSLWRSRIDFARLHLNRPTFNVVRNAGGEWNVEHLLLDSGIASPLAGEGGRAQTAGSLDLEADAARINFKVREDKKPFAITDLGARLNFDHARGLLRFRLTGSPVRTDLSLPSPGTLELEGTWTPGRHLDGPVDATLRTKKSLLYDWVPLVTSHNPEIYGVLDASLRLSGSARILEIEGDGELGQLHHWELAPPSDSTPVRFHVRGEFNRRRGRVTVEDMGFSFADSRLHLAGSVDKIPVSPELDLSIAFDDSRLQDLVALSRRFWGGSSTYSASGRVDGIVAVQGPWSSRRYGGLMTARDVRLSAPWARIPVPEALFLIDGRGVRLAPVRIALTPRVELVAEGTLGAVGQGEPGADAPDAYTARPPGRARERRRRRLAVTKSFSQAGAASKEGGAPRYELTFSAHALPLRELLRLARSIGFHRVQGLEAEDGTAAGAFRVAGLVWPPARPLLEGRIEVDSARLLVPGLSEPLIISRALIESSGERIVASPVVAALGDNTFAGRLEHEGGSRRPWKFEVRTDKLSLEQGALWFEALGHTPPSSIFDRLPGLSSFTPRRTAASNLFGSLNAKGLFMASALAYRSLALQNFRAAVEISERVIRLRDATFRTGGGRGRGAVEADLTAQPARWAGEVALEEANLQSVAPRLPAALRKLKGSISGFGRFETRGLTREETGPNLRGQASLSLKAVSFGDFDPLEALAREGGLGTLEPARKGVAIRSAAIALQVRSQHVLLAETPVELGGARLELSGDYGFDGTLDLGVHADLSHLARRWQSLEALGPGQTNDGRLSPGTLPVDVHLAGPLNRLAIVPAVQISRSSPSGN